MSAPPQPRVEVVDQEGNALLVRVFTKAQYQPLICRHFLVGQDSNLTTIPFVTQVHKCITTKGEIVYRASGHHLVRGIVSAPDHENLYLKDWHAAYRAKSGPWGRNGRQVGGD